MKEAMVDVRRKVGSEPRELWRDVGGRGERSSDEHKDLRCPCVTTSMKARVTSEEANE